MAEFDQEAYQPQEGDIYIIEPRAVRFVAYRYNGLEWVYLVPMTEQDMQTLTAPMQFIGESRGFRRYYRPTGTTQAGEENKQ